VPLETHFLGAVRAEDLGVLTIGILFWPQLVVNNAGYRSNRQVRLNPHLEKGRTNISITVPQVGTD